MKFISPILAGFSITMSLVFAYFLIFTEFYSNNLSGTKRTITIIVLISYSIYRLYRLIKDFLIKKNNQYDT